VSNIVKPNQMYPNMGHRFEGHTLLIGQKGDLGIISLKCPTISSISRYSQLLLSNIVLPLCIKSIKMVDSYLI